jgi:hypothetical protein
VRSAGSLWSLRNSNTSGTLEISFAFGSDNDLPVIWANS